MEKQINLSNFLNPFGYIYCHQNMINGKKYIGANIGKKNSRRKFINGKGKTLMAFLNAYQGCTHFYNALKKYGIEVFETNVLAFTIDLNDTNKKERYFIKKYNTLDRRYGYNLKKGGNNSNHSKESIKKMSERQKGEKNSFYGKHHTDKSKKKIRENGGKYWKGKIFSKEHRKNISEGRKGIPTWMKGKKHSLKARKKISEAQMGEKNHMWGKKYSKKDKIIQRNSHQGEKYYCSFCKGKHYIISIKGKKHLQYKKEVKS